MSININDLYSTSSILASYTSATQKTSTESSSTDSFNSLIEPVEAISSKEETSSLTLNEALEQLKAAGLLNIYTAEGLMSALFGDDSENTANSIIDFLGSSNVSSSIWDEMNSNESTSDSLVELLSENSNQSSALNLAALLGSSNNSNTLNNSLSKMNLSGYQSLLDKYVDQVASDSDQDESSNTISFDSLT